MRKILSLLLALTMVLGCMLTAFAGDEDSLISPADKKPEPAALLSGVCCDEANDCFYFTDTNAKLIRKLDSAGKLSIFCGKSSVAGLDGVPLPDYNDGLYENATFAEPWAITPYIDGFAISDAANNKLRYMADGKVKTINVAETFSHPTGLATDDKGNIYVSDTGNNRIVEIAPTGRIMTRITGLYEPTGLWWTDGTLYIAETGKNRIMTWKDGRLGTLAGKAIADGDEFAGGYVNGKIENAQFSRPEGVCVADGIVYIADTGNSALRTIEEGRVKTFMESTGFSVDMIHLRGVLAKGEFLYVTDNFSGKCYIVSRAVTPFTDVEEGDWFAAAVDKAREYSIISGYTDGSFKPEKAVTRAEFAKMLSNTVRQLDGQMVFYGSKEFADVTDSDWFANVFRWAGDNGYINGVAKDGAFYGMPRSNITREQLVAIIYRVAEAQNLSFKADETLKTSNYTDADKISAYAAISMEWGIQTGLITGFTDSTLRPSGTVTRAQAATILTRFLEAAGY